MLIGYSEYAKKHENVRDMYEAYMYAWFEEHVPLAQDVYAVFSRMKSLLSMVDRLRADWGDDIITDWTVSESEPYIAKSTFMPDSISGYYQEYDLDNGKSRNCGFGSGCFWTEWE